VSVPYSLYELVLLTTDRRPDLPDHGHHISNHAGSLVRSAGRVGLCQRRTLCHHGVCGAILVAPHTASVKRLTGRTIPLAECRLVYSFRVRLGT
jgi:hypothetical protein